MAFFFPDKIYKKKSAVTRRKLFGIIPWGKQSKEDVIAAHLRSLSERERDDREELQKVIDEAYALRDKEEKMVQLKDDIKQEMPKILTDDVKRVLRVTDDLLGQMPEDVVEKFVHSPDFELYKKVMKKVHEPLQNNEDELQKLDKVLTLLHTQVIDADEARKMLGLSIRHLEAKKVEKMDKKGVLSALKGLGHED